MSVPPTNLSLATVITVWLASFLMFILAALLAAPMTFFLMLFLGNLGLHLSFIACIPGGMTLCILRTRINTVK